MRISDFLNHGQDGAVPLKHLVKITGLHERDIRSMIERERRAGALILSDNASGYYLSASAEETERFINSMRHRVGEILKTAACIEQAAGERVS